MKNAKKKLFLSTIIILTLVVIGVAVALFLITHLNRTENTEIETLRPYGNLQEYDFPDFEPVWGQVAFPGEYDKEKDVLVDYAYSDKYFEIDSTIYNPSLSTMSLCLELSAWSSRNEDVWAEKTKNARKLLDEIGFEDFEQNNFWGDSPSTESIGVVAAHKELEDCTLIALPVRGGGYYNEWGSNVEVGTTGEHTGFAEGRDNVIKFLEKYIVTHNITGRVKIWLVGYSRGGAVANLVAGYLNENGLPNGATLAFEDLYCYAFEPPQGSVVELTGSDEEHCNIHNIVNPNDIVTMVAPVNWTFTRYNSTSRLLPTITTAEFENALAVMLEEYEEILADVELSDPDAAIYNVSEYAKRIDVNVNPLNFLPSGDPVVDIQVVDDTSQTMNEVLTSFISSFADSLDGREKYNTSLEADLVYLLDQMMGYETGFETDKILTSVMETMTANDGENLKYVLAPIFALNLNSAEERTSEVVARLHEVLPQPEGFTDLYGTAATLIKAMGDLIVQHPDEFLDTALAFTNSKVFQSHYEEVTLAWVRAGDPHYTDTPYTMAVPEILRTVRVNCPGDVEVYDSEGNLVANMIDKVATTNNAVVGCAINEDGEIIIHLPADAEYNVVTTATGDGEVNITLSEYNVVHSCVTRVQNYTDIPVESGSVLTLNVSNLIEKEYTDEKQQGSTAEYKLLGNSGEIIPCQSDSRGSEIEYFDVSVHKNNTFGVVNGGGRYLDGTFAMVEAQPVAGGEFIGWYINDKLVSTETIYRFAVDCDTTLTAYFSEVPLHELTFGTSGEGTVFNTDYSYSAGSRVQLSAEAAEGYVLDHWETTAGTIEDASNAQTVFIMPDGDAAVTAVFRLKVCPACHEKLANGEIHEAGCGVEDHYTCDGRSHILLNCGHFACDGGDHTTTMVCGHLACVTGNHSEAPCGTAGHYVCDGADHTTILDCGHFACDGCNDSTETEPTIEPAVYTVTFDANGGTLSGEATATADYNTTITLPEEPVKTGYTFEGWFTEATGGTEFTADSKITANCTLYAHWNASEAKIVFDPNGGTGGPQALTGVTNETISDSFPTGQPIREGFGFIGWYPVSDGSGEQITAYPFAFPAGTTTYYAKWAINSYTVTFDANGGTLSGETTVTADYNTTIALPEEPVKTGYMFEGWFTEATGGTEFTANSKVTADCALYAHWTASEAKIVFDPNGGIGGPQALTGVTNETISDSFPTEQPTREGFDFIGWYPVSDGSGEQITAYPSVFPAGTTMYYAKWAYIAGDFTILGGTPLDDYKYEVTADSGIEGAGVLTILSGTPITVSGSTTKDTIAVAEGVSANVTFSDVSIDLRAVSGNPPAPVTVTGAASTVIILEGSNTIKADSGHAGLEKNDVDSPLIIRENGTGSLTAISSGAAGIGSSGLDTGNITIESGTIYAEGNASGAGIGGTYNANGSNITISGGAVTAIGGDYGAGIGGGSCASGDINSHGHGTDIIISGGTVTATGGKYGGAGIGGGTYGGDGSNITISGGYVVAAGGGNGAGIGGGAHGDTDQIGFGSSIFITGGIVRTTANSSAAYIGNGDGADVSTEIDNFTCGIVFKGSSGKVYGEATLSQNLTIAAGETLHIPSGAKLIIPSGVTLTNNGTITYDAENQGEAITGSIEGSGTVASALAANTLSLEEEFESESESETQTESESETLTESETEANFEIQSLGTINPIMKFLC
ncbi:InlB B-repeat-containing protein [Frisingicoccus sp.]|uniref:InlB B-repeat-containing protein n=1 Tax=Frisingicoccus sp. TaxID=1918627 RepID=UPI003AB72F14